MKIVANVNDSTFLVEASSTELAQVMGFSGTYDLKDRREIGVGREIPVSKLWEALSVSRTRKDEIAKLANDLRKVAGRVDGINQTLAAPIVEVKS